MHKDLTQITHRKQFYFKSGLRLPDFAHLTLLEFCDWVPLAEIDIPTDMMIRLKAAKAVQVRAGKIRVTPLGQSLTQQHAALISKDWPDDLMISLKEPTQREART